MRYGHPAPASDLCGQEMAWSQHEGQSQSLPAFWQRQKRLRPHNRGLQPKGIPASTISKIPCCTVFRHIAWTADCCAGLADYELALSLSSSCVHHGHGILPAHDRPEWTQLRCLRC